MDIHLFLLGKHLGVELFHFICSSKRKQPLPISVISGLPQWGSGDSGLEPGSESPLTGSESRQDGVSVAAVTNTIIVISRWWRREAN